MSCKCASVTDEYHGWECTVTGGPCEFLIPNSKLCAEIFHDGPDFVEPDKGDPAQDAFIKNK